MRPYSLDILDLTRIFRAMIRERDYETAAETLLEICKDDTPDPQDWLSNGDREYLLNIPLLDLAAEWEELN